MAGDIAIEVARGERRPRIDPAAQRTVVHRRGSDQQLVGSLPRIVAPVNFALASASAAEVVILDATNFGVERRLPVADDDRTGERFFRIEVVVEPDARTATAQAGCLLGDVDRALYRYNHDRAYVTTVLAKACVPLVVLPVVTFAAIVGMHLALLLLSTVALLLNGHGAGPLWRELQPFRMWLTMLYSLVALGLGPVRYVACATPAFLAQHGRPAGLEEVKRLVALLDTPTRQVQIEARILETTVDFDVRLAIGRVTEVTDTTATLTLASVAGTVDVGVKIEQQVDPRDPQHRGQSRVHAGQLDVAEAHPGRVGEAQREVEGVHRCPAEQRPDDRALLNAIFRGFHTVKGGAGFLQLDAMVECCHSTENLFDMLRNPRSPYSPVNRRVEVIAITGLARLCSSERAALKHER